MSLIDAIRFGLGFLDLILLLLVAEHHYQSTVLKKLSEDLNKDREQLNDISEKVKKYERES